MRKFFDTQASMSLDRGADSRPAVALSRQNVDPDLKPVKSELETQNETGEQGTGSRELKMKGDTVGRIIINGFRFPVLRSPAWPGLTARKRRDIRECGCTPSRAPAPGRQ